MRIDMVLDNEFIDGFSMYGVIQKKKDKEIK